MSTRQAFTFVRPEEAQLVKDTADAVKQAFGQVRFLEIGVFGGGTVYGLAEYCRAQGIPVFAAGVDFESWRPNPPPTEDYAFYPGDSMDMWRNITRRDFNFLFVDGCHCVNHAMADFLNYSPYVEVGGYCLFHDTALPDGSKYQEEWPQDHGYAGKPDSFLGVRAGLQKLGLLQGHRADWAYVRETPGAGGLMGMHLYRKVKAL